MTLEEIERRLRERLVSNTSAASSAEQLVMADALKAHRERLAALPESMRGNTWGAMTRYTGREGAKEAELYWANFIERDFNIPPPKSALEEAIEMVEARWGEGSTAYADLLALLKRAKEER